MSRYAKLSELKVGDSVQVDGGFSCMARESIKQVKVDPNGRKWIACKDGKHYLDGQADDGEHCVGVVHVK